MYEWVCVCIICVWILVYYRFSREIEINSYIQLCRKTSEIISIFSISVSLCVYVHVVRVCTCMGYVNILKFHIYTNFACKLYIKYTVICICSEVSMLNADLRTVGEIERVSWLTIIMSNRYTRAQKYCSLWYWRR